MQWALRKTSMSPLERLIPLTQILSDLAFSAAAIDNFQSAIETHHYNFPDSLSICDDIKNIDENWIHEKPCPAYRI